MVTLKKKAEGALRKNNQDTIKGRERKYPVREPGDHRDVAGSKICKDCRRNKVGSGNRGKDRPPMRCWSTSTNGGEGNATIAEKPGGGRRRFRIVRDSRLVGERVQTKLDELTCLEKNEKNLLSV